VRADVRVHDGDDLRLADRASAGSLAAFDAPRSSISDLGPVQTRRAAGTGETLINDLIFDRQLARDLKQPMAAVKETMSIAALAGLLIKREEVGAPGASDRTRCST
jgi:hypothetical protein